MALGLGLAGLWLRTGERRRVVGILHGLTGAVGLGSLIFALLGPRRGDAMGVGSFGIAAAMLFVVALAFGLVIPLLGKRPAGPVIAAHATLAITAFVLFLAWVSVG